jgi:hypothetical protein
MHQRINELDACQYDPRISSRAPDILNRLRFSFRLTCLRSLGSSPSRQLRGLQRQVSFVVFVAIAGCGVHPCIDVEHERPGGVYDADAPTIPSDHTDEDLCSLITQMGCASGRKCTWVHATDPDPATGDPGIGADSCVPNGTVELGGQCTYRAAQDGGYDNCVRGTVCVDGTCKAICDNYATSPSCPSAQACKTYDGLFANVGSTIVPAGVCVTTCDPLADNDFDGSGSLHTKSGTTCGSDPLVGCYGIPSAYNRIPFTCSTPVMGTEHLTHRSVVPTASQYVNACAPGYTIIFAHDATGSNAVDCYAWCSPGDSYLGAPAQEPNGVSPHGCNTTDAVGAFGVAASATMNGEHCVYSWLFEIDDQNVLHGSRTSDSVGVCWDHTKYRYDADGDGTPDTAVEACATLPLQPAGSGPSAVDWGCVSTSTAGIMSGGTVRRRFTVPR